MENINERKKRNKLCVSLNCHRSVFSTCCFPPLLILILHPLHSARLSFAFMCSVQAYFLSERTQAIVNEMDAFSHPCGRHNFPLASSSITSLSSAFVHFAAMIRIDKDRLCAAEITVPFVPLICILP